MRGEAVRGEERESKGEERRGEVNSLFERAHRQMDSVCLLAALYLLVYPTKHCSKGTVGWG
jgi:hypothetical protein